MIAAALGLTWGRARPGMTLVEVTVAMTLMAIGVVGALGAVGACVRAHTAAEQYSYGVLLAERVATDLDGQATIQAGNLTGVFDESAPDYSWAAQVDSAGSDGIYPVVITVYWRNKTRQLQLTTSVRPHAMPGPPPTTGQGAGGGGAGGGGGGGGGSAAGTGAGGRTGGGSA